MKNGCARSPCSARHRLAFEARDHPRGVLGGVTFWYRTALRLDRDQRALLAQAEAADAGHLALVAHVLRLDRLLERRLHLVAARRQAARGHAHLHVVRVAAPARPVPPARSGRDRHASWRIHSFMPGDHVGAARACPSTSPSMTAAGARPHEPKQRAVSSDTSPPGVVCPALMPDVLLDVVHDGAGALDVAGRAGAHHAGVPALRLQREEAVEGRDAVDLATAARAGRARAGRAPAARGSRRPPARCAAPRSASARGGRDGASSTRRASSGCPWRAAWVVPGSVAMSRLLREHRRDAGPGRSDVLARRGDAGDFGRLRGRETARSVRARVGARGEYTPSALDCRPARPAGAEPRAARPCPTGLRTAPDLR